MGIKNAGAAPFLFFIYREESRTLQDIGLWRTDTVSVTGRAEPEQVVSLDVTDGVLPIPGVQPLLGRSFSRQDDTPGSPDAVMLTFGYWRSKFGGDASVIGQRVLVGGRASEIVGVRPATFRFLDRNPALMLPLRIDRNKTFLGGFGFTAVARLTPGVTIAEASADVARMIPIALHGSRHFRATTRRCSKRPGWRRACSP